MVLVVATQPTFAYDNRGDRGWDNARYNRDNTKETQRTMRKAERCGEVYRSKQREE